MLIARSLYLLAIIMGLSGCDGSGSFTLPLYLRRIYLSVAAFTDKVEQLFVAKGESVKGAKAGADGDFLAENALRVAEENVQAERRCCEIYKGESGLRALR